MDPTKKELYTAKRASGVNTDDPEIQTKWDELRSDDSNTNWMILYLSAPTIVSVKAYGSGGIEEFISNLDDNEIYFCAIKCSVNNNSKFFHIYFIGENVGGMKKGKASLYEAGIFQALEGSHGRITFNNGRSEVTNDAIIDKIKSLSNGATDIIIYYF